MQRINASWRKQADFPELFLDELLETVELIETAGVLGTPYNVKTKHRVTRLRIEKSEYYRQAARGSPPENERQTEVARCHGWSLSP